MNDLNDFKNICRTCMFSCDIKYTQDNVISDVFYKLTDILFETNVELPQQICRKCFEKFNEIHAFALQCKQTHSTLMKCLNNIQNKRFKREQNKREEPIKIKEEITTDEPTIEFVEVKELKIKQELNESPETKVVNEQESNRKEEHPNNNVDVAQEKEYKCDVCNKTFIHHTSFKRHKSLHSGDGPYKCNQCPKSFARSNHLKDHTRTHSGERPYKCEQCAKTFILSNHLKEHMRTHSGERPYNCKQCAKSFTQSNHLKQHMLTHTGERPYKCDQCSKSFTRSDILISHTRSHNGERPFKCNLCSKSFTQSNNLTTHMRTHKQFI